MAAPNQSTAAAVDGTGAHDDPLSSLPQSERPLEMSDLAASSRGNTGVAEHSAVDGPTSSSPLAPNEYSNSNTTPVAANMTTIDGSNPPGTADVAPSASEHPIDPLTSSSRQPASSSSGTAANAESSTSSTTPAKPSATALRRLDSEAIGPSQETMPQPVVSEAGPVLVITLLLTSGARHPYKIDEKYLAKRNVNVPGTTESGKKDPFSISVYTLKELILREWREEWEPQPSSPSSIRLIYFGHFLDDKASLKDSKLNANAANVVHMTVRPQDIADEEDAAKSKTMARDREGGEATAGCRCVIL